MEKFKIQLNFGSIAGLGAFVLFVILYLLGYNPLGHMKWLGLWIPVVLVYKGIKKYRDDELGGEITYGKALLTGMFVSFVFASLFAILVYLFGFSVDDSFVEMTKNEAVEGLEQAAQFIGEEYTEKAIEQIQSLGVADIAWGEFQNKIFGGFIVSLIVAGILKKTKSPFEESTHAEQN